MPAIVGNVRNEKLRLACGDIRVHGKEFCRPVVGRARALVAGIRAVGCRGGNDADDRLRQRFFQGRKRDSFEMRPLIGFTVAKHLVILPDALDVV